MSRFLAKFLTIVSLALPIVGQAQTPPPPTTLEGWADRLDRFGKAIPQEKVFVHMDNTCYFLGDTIWFAAYTRRTDTDLPSDASRVLYVELLNQDGFLVERQVIEMKGGRGHGNFALSDTLYGGYYELRAYTRWQLNWGLTEKEHTSDAEAWFFNKDMAHEYYRDYDKLYSRVFPVYDKPQAAGEYFRDMTTRPLRRYFKSGAPEPQLMLSLFPEGGHAVAGVPCRVAFEAATEAGEVCEGNLQMNKEKLRMNNEKEEEVESVATVSRGRGVFTFTPEAGQEYEFTFTAQDGRTATATLPVESDGVALSVERKGDAWEIQVHAAGAAAAKPLGLTIMHEGKTVLFEPVHSSFFTLHSSLDSLSSGIHQVTVFDANGRVWADRLFFVTKPELLHSSLLIEGLKDQYEPFERAELQVTAPSLSGRAGGESALSLSVRDAATQDYTYDNGNILTEMLLASEIKGFVPQPEYFFEADDEEHRTALDLLMLTQGWRRFDWHTMATPGVFELVQPAETQTPYLRGEVLNYSASLPQDDVLAFDNCELAYKLEDSITHAQEIAARNNEDISSYLSKFRKGLRTSDEGLSTEDTYIGAGQGEVIETIIAQSYARESNFPAGSYQMQGIIAAERFHAKENALGKEVRVHADFTQPGSESVIGDVDTRQGRFSIQSPRFDGYCILYLAASDTTKWKEGKSHIWINMDETRDPEYYVRISQPYPRFTKPYTYYQTAYQSAPNGVAQNDLFSPSSYATQLQMVTVRAKHGGMRRLDLSKPAYVIDAYKAFNEACDAGLMCGQYRGRFHFINSVARLFCGDMQTHNYYLVEPRYDGANVSRSQTASFINRFNQLTNLESVRLYTDYNPRTGGDPRAKEDNVERLTVALHQLPDEGQRVTYRDRRYILQGFNVADDFYHPNYQRTPPTESKKDYRRTLYWNPDLQLDADGHATVTFFTGSKPATIMVEANGQAGDGTLLTN